MAPCAPAVVEVFFAGGTWHVRTRCADGRVDVGAVTHPGKFKAAVAEADRLGVALSVPVLVPHRCLDCGEDDVGYMVHKDIWREAGMPFNRGFLCPCCLEKRLGRLLTLDDFPDAPINEGIRFGYRLAKRGAPE